MKYLIVLFVGSVVSLSAIVFVSCAKSGGAMDPIAGNEGGSAPINEQEINQYKRAVLKCYKTGGTRVVKIQGTLRCF